MRGLEMLSPELPVPSHFAPERVGEVWRVPYQDIAAAAADWRAEHEIRAAAEDRLKVCLVLVDMQNTFCIPGFELFVGGRSGTGAVDDGRRLCRFIYRNLANITKIIPTLDTHQVMQIFHAIFLVDDNGDHPMPYSLITVEDVASGRWKFNPALSDQLQISADYGQKHLEHYTRQLRRSGKYDLTVWPYHAMLGGIGHAIVSSAEEAVFFHGVARYSQPDMHVKGGHPLTEHYSVLGPEVSTDCAGERLTEKSGKFVKVLRDYDAVIITGQAKSHCVAWTIADLLEDVKAHGSELASKIYLLEDCTSPVVVPGVIDYTDQADEAFRRFRDSGMHVVRSTVAMEDWPGLGKP
jgi:nicotinamidase-related amidase